LCVSQDSRNGILEFVCNSSRHFTQRCEVFLQLDLILQIHDLREIGKETDRAFDPSYRGRGAQAVRAGGRGLGLTLSRELVEAMGGSISLWSEEDRGAEVRVLLPVAPEMAS